MSNANAKPKIGVMIATPVRYWKGIEQFHQDFRDVLALLSKLTSDETCPYEFQFCAQTKGVCRARNEIVGNFRKQRIHNPSLKWLVWLDDDIAADTPQAMVDAILRLLSHKRPIVGALYCRRADPPIWVCNFAFDVEVEPNGLMQVIELGIGLKAYNYQVFDLLEQVYPTLKYFDRDTGEQYYGFFQQVIMNEDAPPEDYFLDWLVRQASGQVKGMGIYADTTLKMKHRGADGTLFPSEWPPIPGAEP